MKPEHLKMIIAQLQAEGYDNEVPLTILKNRLSQFVGVDKYKLKYSVEIVVELGYFSWRSPYVLTINNGYEK